MTGRDPVTNLSALAVAKAEHETIGNIHEKLENADTLTTRA